MNEASESEVIELDDLDDFDEFDPGRWNAYATERGWSDGFPLVVPTETAVDRFVATCRGDNVPLQPISPRRVMPRCSGFAAPTGPANRICCRRV